MRTGYRKPILSRLLEHSYMTSNGCMMWTGVLKDSGYGVFKINEKRYGAHVVSFLESGGELKADECVLHTCDNRACINPDHLFVGTKGDNNTDRHKKGRSRNQHTGPLQKEENICQYAYKGNAPPPRRKGQR